MKIKQLDIAGFRSLKNVSWQPGDLNVVIGPNGSGKSNLLRALELISASAQGQLTKYIQANGGLYGLLWDGVVDSISFRLKTEPTNYVVEGEEEERYEVKIARAFASGLHRIQREIWSTDYDGGIENEKPYENFIDRSEGKILLGKKTINLDERISSKETLLSLFNSLSPLDSATFLQWFREKLAGIIVYQDLNVGQNSLIRQAVVPSYEKRVAANGGDLVPVLHTLYTTDREFKRGIDTAMSAAFGVDFEELVFPPAADQRIQLRIRWKTLKREQSAADLSDGTLRFLLLLTILTSPDPPMLIAIDEPETGLHPSMFPIIAEYAVEASTRTQVVFTTHSPQFLDAFTDVKPTTTVAKWEDGETSLHVLAGDELKYWLSEYSLGSLFTSGELEAMI